MLGLRTWWVDAVGDDTARSRRVSGDAGRRRGGRRSGRARVHRLDAARVVPGLAAQSPDRRGGRSHRGRAGLGRGAARRIACLAGGRRAGRSRNRPGGGGGSRSDRRHRRVLRRRADVAGGAARSGLGVVESASGPSCGRFVVRVAGGVQERVVPARAQRAVHRADRIRGLHHRGRRRVPSRGRRRRAGSVLRHGRLYAVGGHVAARGARIRRPRRDRRSCSSRICSRRARRWPA